MEFQYEKDRIFATDETGRLLAEVTFPTVDGVAVLNHTFVHPDLAGQGIAARLVQAAADQLRAQGLRVRPTCSYAVAWFARHSQQQDLLV
jgi:predicted GNAT family acetyltransferase